ncbi:hypothetical protein Tco_1419977 [Tanacetum coccineum]
MLKIWLYYVLGNSCVMNQYLCNNNKEQVKASGYLYQIFVKSNVSVLKRLFRSFYIYLVLLIYEVTRPRPLFGCDPIWGCYILDKEKEITEEKVILEWGDEQDSKFSNDVNDDVEKHDKDGDADDKGDDHFSDTQDANDEDDKTEYDEDEIYKYKIRMRKDEDVEMKDAEVEQSDKGEEKVTNAAKEEAKKTSEAKDDTKKSKLPPSSSSLSVSLCFGDQFLKLSFDSSLVSTIKDTADAYVSSLRDIPIQKETPKPISTAVPSPQVTPIISSVQQTPTPIPTQPITTDAPTIMTAIHKSDALFVVELKVAKLEKDVSELKIVDRSSEALVHLPELTKKPTPTAEQESKKSPSEILNIKKEQAKKQNKP